MVYTGVPAPPHTPALVQELLYVSDRHMPTTCLTSACYLQLVLCCAPGCHIRMTMCLSSQPVSPDVASHGGIFLLNKTWRYSLAQPYLRAGQKTCYIVGYSCISPPLHTRSARGCLHDVKPGRTGTSTQRPCSCASYDHDTPCKCTRCIEIQGMHLNETVRRREIPLRQRMPNPSPPLPPVYPCDGEVTTHLISMILL
jgi:hypothetical protein